MEFGVVVPAKPIFYKCYVNDTHVWRKKVFSRSTKLPVHWSSKIPVRYKHNVITGKLHQAKRIAPDFNKELKIIRQKYLKAGFLLKFINETICNFERGKEEVIIPECLFDDRKLFHLGSHILLRTKKLVKYLWEKSKIS